MVAFVVFFVAPQRYALHSSLEPSDVCLTPGWVGMDEGFVKGVDLESQRKKGVFVVGL